MSVFLTPAPFRHEEIRESARPALEKTAGRRLTDFEIDILLAAAWVVRADG